MMKMVSRLTIFIFLLSLITANVSYAASFSGGSRPSVSTPKIQTPKSISTPKNNLSTTKSTSTPKNNIQKTKTTRESPKLNYNSKTTSPQIIKQREQSIRKYEKKSFFESGTFVPTLLTAAGVYLVLDSITDEGDPVYIDQETGQKIPAEKLDNLNVEPYQEETADKVEEVEIISNYFIEMSRPLMFFAASAFLLFILLIVLKRFV